MRDDILSRVESQALRGIAILGIVLHNYCHFLGFAVKENEYTFTAEKPMQMLEKVMALDKDLFIHFFSSTFASSKLSSNVRVQALSSSNLFELTVA